MALGEAVDIINRDFKDDHRERLFAELLTRLGSGEVQTCPIPEERLGELSDLIRQIRSHDRMIGTTDVMLLACAMLDQECRTFLTFDSDMIGSRGLTKLIAKHVAPKRRFRIADRIRD